MNHYSTGADPYDAGAALGRALRADGLSPGQAHLPALSAEKRDFGEKSARICAAEYPSLLAEIRGLADGLKMPFSDLAAFLFGIYNFPPFQGCTCFAAQGEGGEVIFGRNSDFLTMFEPYDASFHYTISGKPTIFSRGCVTGLRARRSNPGRGTIFPLPKTCFQANSDSSASMTAASGPIPSGRLSVCCGRGGFSAARATHPGMNGARTSG